MARTGGEPRQGIPQDPATSQTNNELHRLESQRLEKRDPVGQPCILMGSGRDKWPLSAPGEIITHPSRHTGTSVPAVKGANTPADEASCVFSRGALAARAVSGNGLLWRGLPGTLSLLLCVVFLVNQLSPTKHYTNVTRPRYSTIKPLKFLPRHSPRLS